MSSWVSVLQGRIDGILDALIVHKINTMHDERGRFASSGSHGGAKATAFKSESFSKEEVKSLRAYSSNMSDASYYDVNAYMRGENLRGADRKLMDQSVSNINSALDKSHLTRDVTVFRGYSDKFADKLSKNPEGMIGKVIKGDSFQSTSAVNTFQNKNITVTTEVKLAKGTPALDMNKYSRFKEDEVLLKPGSYRITHMKREGSRVLFKAVYTPAD